MEITIPSIYALFGKNKHEVDAIIRLATQIAASEHCQREEREAALQTIVICQRILTLQSGPRI